MAFTDQTPLFILFFLALLLLSTTHAIRHQTPVFSLSLHPRDSVVNPQDQNHTARTISMLAGDLTRLKYINSRLRGSARFISDWDNFQPEDVQSPVTASGGGYVARIRVGQPAEELYVLMDTGGEVTWIQCLPCQSCYQQSDPIFDPSKSSGFRLPLFCIAPQCIALPPQSRSCSSFGTCRYTVMYGDNSVTSGDYVMETVSFGSPWGLPTTADVAMGCGHYNKGNFQDFAGIMGLSWGKAAFPTQIGPTSFSYCFLDPHYSINSSSTLEFNSIFVPDYPNTIVVPLLRNSNFIFYYLEITGITVGQDQILIPPSVYQINGADGTGGIIIDSGTTLTYFDEEVYNPLRDAFKRNAPNLNPFETSFPGLDTCYPIPSGYASGVDLPSLSFQFGGGLTLPLPPENYLVPAANSTFCLSFQPKPRYRDMPFSIIGNAQQRRVRVTYYLSNSLIGFTPNQC